jgi:DNA-binding CsgD family transcriptional regulator/predicted ATPase
MGRAEGIFSGRERELERVGNLFDLAKSGSGGIAMIEGVPGIGKTVLLAKIADMAAERGFTIMEFSDLDIIDERRPAVTFSVRGPLTTRAIEVVGLRQLQRHIEAQTVHGPVLIVGDDLQDARRCAIRALATLLRRFREWAVMWALAARPSPGLADFLDRVGDWPGPVCFMELDRLPDETVAELVERLVDAEPDPELMELVGDAAGRPLLVTALVSGMLAERTVRAGSGAVHRLASHEPPAQLVRTVQRHLDELSPLSRALVTVAASLGETFTLDDVAEVLGALPARLLGPLDEAVRHGILVGRGRSPLTFASELFRRTISDEVPETVTSALLSTLTGHLPAPIETPLPELNDVEREIVHMVGRGMTNVQIASRLVKSEHTVNYHLQKIFRRLDVHSRAELIGRLQGCGGGRQKHSRSLGIRA